MRLRITLLIPLLFILTMTGCTYTREYVEVDTTTPVLEQVDSAYEDGQTNVEINIPVDNEKFNLICTYDTGDYPLNNWRVTANKSIHMSVKTDNLPAGYKVYIEHMHADISLKSTDPQLDGITQDSMDDSDHRIPSNGFPISNTIEYNNIFAIEGYTDHFYKMWTYYCNGNGYTSGSRTRLSEQNIRDNGTYAEKLSVVYDIVIHTPECEEGYIKSVYSEVLIPLTGEIKTVETDLFGNIQE